MNTYYVVIEEWNYPTESGSEVVLGTFENAAEARKMCSVLADGERDNFIRNVGEDVRKPEICANGVIITTKLGIDPFYYYARYIPVESLQEEINMSVNKQAKSIRCSHDNQEN